MAKAYNLSVVQVKAVEPLVLPIVRGEQIIVVQKKQGPAIDDNQSYPKRILGPSQLPGVSFPPGSLQVANMDKASSMPKGNTDQAALKLQLSTSPVIVAVATSNARYPAICKERYLVNIARFSILVQVEQKPGQYVVVSKEVLPEYSDSIKGLYCNLICILPESVPGLLACYDQSYIIFTLEEHLEACEP